MPPIVPSGFLFLSAITVATLALYYFCKGMCDAFRSRDTDPLTGVSVDAGSHSADRGRSAEKHRTRSHVVITGSTGTDDPPMDLNGDNNGRTHASRQRDQRLTGRTGPVPIPRAPVAVLRLTEDERRQLIDAWESDAGHQRDLKLRAFFDDLRSGEPVPIYFAQLGPLFKFSDRSDLLWLSTAILKASRCSEGLSA